MPIAAGTASQSATIAWTDPAILYAVHASRTWIELFRAMMVGEAPLEPAMALIGAEIVSVEQGEVVLALAIGERHLDHTGHAHTGIIAALTDTAAGYAVHTQVPAGVRCASVEFHVGITAPAPLSAGRILIVGRTIRIGARTANCEAKVVGANGALHAAMTMTMIVLPSRAA